MPDFFTIHAASLDDPGRYEPQMVTLHAARSCLGPARSGRDEIREDAADAEASSPGLIDQSRKIAAAAIPSLSCPPQGVRMLSGGERRDLQAALSPRRRPGHFDRSIDLQIVDAGLMHLRLPGEYRCGNRGIGGNCDVIVEPFGAFRQDAAA